LTKQVDEWDDTNDRVRDQRERMADPRPGVRTDASGLPAPLHDEIDDGPPLSTDEAQRFRSAWEEIQTSFVDDPRRSVERADELVEAVTSRLTQVFSDARSDLESQWTRGDDVSTEDLRMAFQRYRSFFDRLLSV
jgi:hypothetical protein